jgi:hypothetical protein
MFSRRKPQPTAMIVDCRTLQSTPESGAQAGYESAKRDRQPKKSPDKVFQLNKRSGRFCFLLKQEEMEEEYRTRYLSDEKWALWHRI